MYDIRPRLHGIGSKRVRIHWDPIHFFKERLHGIGSKSDCVYTRSDPCGSVKQRMRIYEQNTNRNNLSLFTYRKSSIKPPSLIRPLSIKPPSMTGKNK